jgi:hypothetical protein
MTKPCLGVRNILRLDDVVQKRALADLGLTQFAGGISVDGELTTLAVTAAGQESSLANDGLESGARCNHDGRGAERLFNTRGTR